jgi:hypothetical protein
MHTQPRQKEQQQQQQEHLLHLMLVLLVASERLVKTTRKVWLLGLRQQQQQLQLQLQQHRSLVQVLSRLAVLQMVALHPNLQLLGPLLLNL